LDHHYTLIRWYYNVPKLHSLSAYCCTGALHNSRFSLRVRAKVAQSLTNCPKVPQFLSFHSNFSPFTSHPTIMSVTGNELFCMGPTEAQARLQSALDDLALESTPDGQFIRWSASNRRHPRNWHASRKIYDSSLIIFLDLFTYVLLFSTPVVYSLH
jgi:hypothetical protein